LPNHPKLYKTVQPSAFGSDILRAEESTLPDLPMFKRTPVTDREGTSIVSAGAVSIEPPPVRLIGRSASMRAIDEEIDRAAELDDHILITGEIGVGKQRAARLIHHRSRRASASVVTATCAELPDILLESELFGHVRGGFAGAYRDKPGLLELAQNGTVFLDEVGEMSTRLQAALLRFPASGDVQRVGAARAHVRVNVRLVAATHRDLQPQIAAGAFREDLYARLQVIRLTLPPLRERTEDIPLLVDFFLESYAAAHDVTTCEVSSDALEALVTYPWPGNVHELKRVVERLAVMARESVVGLDDLPAEVIRAGASQPVAPRPAPPTESQRGTPITLRTMNGTILPV
jgi:DNA-binding NtrC family response regulator